VTGRAPTLADAPAIAALLNRLAAEQGAGWVDDGEVESWLTLPGVELEDFRVFEEGGELVAYGDIQRPPVGRSKAWLDVRGARPEEVLAWAERRAGELGVELLRAQTPSTAGLDPLLEQRGYRTIRHSFQMEIVFAEQPSAPAWPAGIVVRPAAEGEEPVAHAVSEEAFADHWEHEPDPFDIWLHHLTRDGFDRSLWFLALDGDEVAGICLCRTRRRGDEELGWCGILGVRRAWRRRGLGSALLQHAFRELHVRGLRRAGLGVDAENLTGAVRLYERAGMQVARRYDTWERRLR
jgi:mycothiol synthase